MQNTASKSIDERFPIEPRTQVMAPHQLSNVPLESKSEFLHDSRIQPMEEMNYHIYEQFYPKNERVLYEAGSESHKGVPTPRMENCIQSTDNEEVINY
jgi:hypothetical protein